MFKKFMAFLKGLFLGKKEEKCVSMRVRNVLVEDELDNK